MQRSLLCGFFLQSCKNSQSTKEYSKNILFGNNPIEENKLNLWSSQPFDTIHYAMKQDLKILYASCKNNFGTNIADSNQNQHYRALKIDFVIPIQRCKNPVSYPYKIYDFDTNVQFYINYNSTNNLNNLSKHLIKHLTIDLIQFVVYVDVFLSFFEKKRIWMIYEYFYHEIYNTIESCFYRKKINFFLCRKLENAFWKDNSQPENENYEFITRTYYQMILYDFIEYMFSKVYLNYAKIKYEEKILTCLSYENTLANAVENINSIDTKIFVAKKEDFIQQKHNYINVKQKFCYIDISVNSHDDAGLFSKILSILRLKTSSHYLNKKIHVCFELSNFIPILQCINMVLIDCDINKETIEEACFENILYRIKYHFIDKNNFLYKPSYLNKLIEKLSNERTCYKITVSLLLDLDIDIYDVIKFLIPQMSTRSIFFDLEYINILKKLTSIYHAILTHSLIYFFAQPNNAIFDFCAFYHYEYHTSNFYFKRNSEKNFRVNRDANLGNIMQYIDKLSEVLCEFKLIRMQYKKLTVAFTPVQYANCFRDQKIIILQKLFKNNFDTDKTTKSASFLTYSNLFLENAEYYNIKNLNKYFKTNENNPNDYQKTNYAVDLYFYHYNCQIPSQTISRHYNQFVKREISDMIMKNKIKVLCTVFNIIAGEKGNRIIFNRTEDEEEHKQKVGDLKETYQIINSKKFYAFIQNLKPVLFTCNYI